LSDDWDYMLSGGSAVVNGNPAMCFRMTDGVVDELMYIRANNAPGTQWGAPVTINGDTSIWSESMAVIQGRPAIVYISDTESLVLYWADDSTGAQWPGPSIINAPCDYCVIADVGGYPAVAYESETTHYLEFGYYLPE
jgi:hypothetical protein